MHEPLRLDLSLLTRDPALAFAVDAAREARRAVEANPEIAEGDPDAFVAVFTLFMFGEANGNLGALRRTIRKRALKSSRTHP